MLKTKRNLLSFFSVCLFIFFGLASKVNHMHMGSFNYANHVEDVSEKGNYLEKNNGDKVHGKQLIVKSGLLTKNEIQIDDQKFKISEIKGYRIGSKYYGRAGTSYIQRIVRGKINIYVDFTDVTSTSSSHDGSTEYKRYYTRTDYHAQRENDDKMIPLASQKDIKNLLGDCPLAVELVDLSDSKISKAIKEDPNYLNNIFDIYNNNCKEVK